MLLGAALPAAAAPAITEIASTIATTAPIVRPMLNPFRATFRTSAVSNATRDRFDATRCDLLFVNLLGAKETSIGTVMEIAWADLLRKPIVLAIEPEGNIHDHGMIKEAIGFRVPSLT